MANDVSKEWPANPPQTNALAAYARPLMDLVGPTVTDDIRRAIWRYGAETVKAAVKEETKAKRGRKREPDWPELREIIESDARDWLDGKDPFAERSNYAIAKLFAERNPGHSVVSTYKRIERKLSRGPYDRRWFTLASAEIASRSGYPFVTHLRALEALSKLPNNAGADTWKRSLARAKATIADYEAREGEPPPANMTFREVEDAARKGGLQPVLSQLQPAPKKSGSLGTILFNALKGPED